MESQVVAGGNAPGPKRQVRRGTHSCWECKRRKTRCIFAKPSEAVCVGCRSRRTKCISQMFDEDLSAVRGQADRLERIESLATQIQENVNGFNISEYPLLSPLATEPALRTELLVTNKSNELSRALTAVWPSQQDLEVILSMSVETPKLLHRVVCNPYSLCQCSSSPSPRDMLLQPPSTSSHPVSSARKLLLLGTFMQCLQPCSAIEKAGLNINCHDIMTRVIDTAITLVTSNDELVQSIEGVECIMIESMYHNKAGNLRRAYLTLRRAITIAQMLHLHRGHIHSSSIAMLEPETRARIHLDSLWFRLIQSDRYLSSMLGLPQAWLGTGFANQKVLECCTPIERMERIDCVATGRILQRNDGDMQDLAKTQEIDKLLQSASACMPPQWWLIPDLSSSSSGNAFDEVDRLMHQLPHYFLLIQLHLPYLLNSSDDRKFDYSKITAVNASRDILTRFVAFRNSQSIGAYCRGVDYLAFIASTVLCLAHIVARPREVDSDRGTIFDFLAHQRPSDRGLIERTTEYMEEATRTSNDVTASKIASTFRHLLAAMEATATNGASYSTIPSFGGDVGCDGQLSDCGTVLCISIPHYGSINVEREADGVAPGTTPRNEGDLTTMPTPDLPKNLDAAPLAFGQLPVDAETQELQSMPPWHDTNDWTLQGVDMAFLDNLMGSSFVPDDREDIWASEMREE
ncbi:hypothetical protein BDV95DRAFT_499682 [Massariosphaeria phaeospora]|uniref:Zn(2)-C6 fungal-type domain-containing protein n=1 Tax=Massariosphaeria phaeospora TaxID=100035 RepID=A0A7C8IB70_9PLEO|nr:hypothetical protein BDV95DRAFT_499682 [Massariosphaeria phaeospora]